MGNILPTVYEQTGRLSQEMTETVVACNEIAGRALNMLLLEREELVSGCLELSGEQLTAITQALTPQDLMVRETQVLIAFASKLRQSFAGVRGIQKVATAELSLCLEDGRKAIQSRCHRAHALAQRRLAN